MTQNHELFNPVLETRTEYHQENPQGQPNDGVVPGTEQPEGDPQGDEEVQKWLEKDHKTVAEAKVNSDRFIKQLQRELAEMRKELNTSLSLQEFLEKQEELRTKEADADSRRRQDGQPPHQYDQEDGEGRSKTKDNNPGSPLEVNLAEEVNKILEERETTNKRSRNLAYVKDKATEALGPEYPYLFSKKAKEMNLDTAYLNGMAQDHPDAFLSLMLGQQYQKQDAGSPPVSNSTSSEGRASVSPTRKKGTHISDWNDIKQEDPRKYLSPSVQNEIFKAALEAEKQGIDFYN